IERGARYGADVLPEMSPSVAIDPSPVLGIPERLPLVYGRHPAVRRLVEPPVEQELRNLPKGAIEHELGQQHDVGPEVGTEQSRSPYDVFSGEAVHGIAVPQAIDQRAEAVAGPRLWQVQPIVVVRRHPSVLVDEPRLRICEHHPRFPIQDLNAARQEFGSRDVIRSCPAEIRSRGQLYCVAKVRCGTAILSVADVADSPVLRRIRARDLWCAIDRRVITDDQLEVLVGLRTQGLERRREIALPVVHGYADTHSGPCACHRPSHGRGRTTSLCAWNASAYPPGAAHSTPRTPISPRKVSS